MRVRLRVRVVVVVAGPVAVFPALAETLAGGPYSVFAV